MICLVLGLEHRVLALDTNILQMELRIHLVINSDNFLFVFETGSPTAQFQLEFAYISQNDLEFLILLPPSLSAGMYHPCQRLLILS